MSILYLGYVGEVENPEVRVLIGDSGTIPNIINLIILTIHRVGLFAFSIHKKFCIKNVKVSKKI